MNTANLIRSVAFAGLIAVVGAAQAQHLDVWVHKDAVNRLESGYFDVNADSSIVPNDRAVGYDFQQFDENPYFANNPGFFAEVNQNADGSANPGGSGLPGGSLVSFNILSDLQYWSGTDPVSFGPVPSGESLLLSLGSNNRLIGTGTGLQAGFTIQAIRTGVSEGSMHQHLNSTINAGQGNPIPSDGIYIAQLELTTNAPGVTKSLPFWVVYNNNLTWYQRGEAINYLYPNQWSGPLGGSYNTASNWTGELPLNVANPYDPNSIIPVPQVPNGQNAVANFFDNLYTASTVTLDSPATVGTLNFSSVPRYTLAGPAALTLSSSSTAQINLKAGSHTIAAPLVIASNTVVAAGAGSLDLQGQQTWSDNTTLSLASGTINYAIPTGPTSLGANDRLSIAAGAQVNVGGAVDPFSDAGGRRVSIVNSSVTGLNINAGSVRVGAVSGSGTTTVAAGSHLTADSIIQGALVIGGTAANAAVVTIDASDASGSPLAANPLASLSESQLAGPIVLGTTPGGSIPATTVFLRGSDAAPSPFAGETLARPGLPTASVPEPPSICLLFMAIAVCRFFVRGGA